MLACKCGHKEKGMHPCHGKEYSCKKPSKQRFYNPKPIGSGENLKFSVSETWACDECWSWFLEKIKNEY